MSVDFQTAVKSNVSEDERTAAIDRLAERGDRKNLAVLVRTDGLAGTFRRRALERLIDRSGTDRLEAIVDDRSVPESLRRCASEAT